MSERIRVRPIAYVDGGAHEIRGNNWGDSRCIIRVDPAVLPDRATKGLEAFSHLELIFHFHRTEPLGSTYPPRRPRGHQDYPEVGVLAVRNMHRPNRLAISRCRLLHVDHNDLHVTDLDAIHGTPILDIKPWLTEMAPRGEVRQPTWSTQIMRNYYAPAPDPE
ncbi:SAM-dependent methyltransferase [Nocardia wallacei]|uniref:SAM-dependent methyltransferase n=1 Tax=Nocardia wallacei TaxID=480035 RepID=UPI002453D4B9|nr:SAM-dependent methyltransferase [Nocardia wallacei]